MSSWGSCSADRDHAACALIALTILDVSCSRFVGLLHLLHVVVDNEPMLFLIQVLCRKSQKICLRQMCPPAPSTSTIRSRSRLSQSKRASLRQVAAIRQAASQILTSNMDTWVNLACLAALFLERKRQNGQERSFVEICRQIRDQLAHFHGRHCLKLVFNLRIRIGSPTAFSSEAKGFKASDVFFVSN